MLFFVCSEAAEYKPVKLETKRTVILPPMVSVFWSSPVTTRTRISLSLSKKL